MGGRLGLAKKVALPNLFSMTLDSAYAKAVGAVLFGGAPRYVLEQVEARITGCTDAGERARLCEETISFRHRGETVSVTVDVARNPQLLGACREVGEFRLGYKPEIHMAIDLLTEPSAVIFDIGSNWGGVSLQAALRESFSGTVFAFEPQAQAFANLTEMIEALALDDRVHALNLATSDIEGTSRVADEQGRGEMKLNSASTGEPCPYAALDGLSLPDPQMIRIGVGGHERHVVAGASRLLQRARPLIVFEDCLENPKDHYQQLAGYGYSFYFLGWYDPFGAVVADKPPFFSHIQIMVLLPFRLDERDELPGRGHVLASPQPLNVGDYSSIIVDSVLG